MKPLFLALLLSGCATPYVNPYLDGEYSSKNIEARSAYKKDYDTCELESMRIAGADVGETVAYQIMYRNKCMKLKGH